MRVSRSSLAPILFLSLSLLLADERQATAQGAEAPFQLAGRLLDDDGRPVAGTEVELRRSAKIATAVTDADGRFVLELPRQPPPWFSLCATTSDKARQAFAFCRLDRGKDLPEETTLVARPAREINVAVTNLLGQPVRDAKVFVGGAQFYEAQATTDSTGKASLRVPRDAIITIVSASKPEVGFDYVRYETPLDQESDPYRLPQNHSLAVQLVLNGCRHVTVRVRDEHGRPLAGVAVRPWTFEKPKKGGRGWMANAGALTDGNGAVRFDTFPLDCSEPVQFWTEVEGYYTPERAKLEPGNEPAEVTATMVKLVPVRGMVAFGDGRPGARAKVQAAGHGYQDESFVGETQADDQGHFELAVYPRQFYVFAASLDGLVTPLGAHVVLDQPPESEIRLRLQRATRVFGRLTVGPEKMPLAGQVVVFNRLGREEYAKLRESDRLPQLDRRSICPSVTSTTLTDEQGRFEFLGGPGKCSVASSAAGAPPAAFVLSDEMEFERDLHVARRRSADSAELTGRVVLKDDPRQGVAEADVNGFALKPIEAPGVMEVTSGPGGSFRVLRRPVAMLVYARTDDGALAGLTRVGPDDRSVVIQIGAAAFAHGRLTDANTGEPLRNMEVHYAVPWDGPHSGTECGGSVKTDDRGEFIADGLVPGSKYAFVAIRDKVPASGKTFSGHWAFLTTVAVEKAENIDLGDFKLDPSGTSKP